MKSNHTVAHVSFLVCMCRSYVPVCTKASLSARRMAPTLVASVCDDTEIQALLPQVIVGNERVLAKGEAHRPKGV